MDAEIDSNVRYQTRSSRDFSLGIGEVALRYLVIIGFCFWMGGFTFYAGVVIHVGHVVFGSHREVGFLTKEVTVWLNRSAAIVLVILLVNQIFLWRKQSSKIRFWAGLTLLIMLGVQIALFFLHPHLDQLLDATNKSILSRSAFRPWHKTYMNLSTVQWTAALIHLLSVLLSWRAWDRGQIVNVKNR